MTDSPATSSAAEARNFEIRRDRLDSCRIERQEIPGALADGQILFRIERFALTSNNISYAVTGDALDYWGFFPAAKGWGRIPAMGFATVTASNHPEVAEGSRCYGWFPMSTHVVVDAQPTRSGIVIDGAPHRAGHAAIYRSYTPSSVDPLYAEEREDQISLLRGLFATSFLIDDFMSDNDFFGARSAIVTSASSKTSIALASLLAKRGHGPVWGLTSAGNRRFVESLGCYSEVRTYDEIAELRQDVPAVVVDMAGNGQVIHDLHHHYGEALKHSCSVGASHWQAQRRAKGLPGPEPQFFFAPKQVEKRRRDWGPGGFEKRLGAAWLGFVEFSDGWLEVVRKRGDEGVREAYLEVLGGRAKPHQGYMLSL